MKTNYFAHCPRGQTALIVVLVLVLASLFASGSLEAQPPPPPTKSEPAKLVPPSQAARYRFEGKGAADGVGAFRKILERLINLPPTSEDLQRAYHDLWETLGDHYYDPSRLKDWETKRVPAKSIQSMEDFDEAVEALFESLGDKWTSYRGKTHIDKIKAKRSAGIHSLGFSLRQVNNDAGYCVASIVFGGPAHQTRLRPGDEVVSIGDVPLPGLNRMEAEALLEGKLEATVKVRIRHRLEDERGQLVGEDLVEETVELKVKATPDASLEVKLLPGGLAYVRLPDFMSGGTDAFLQIAFLRLMKETKEEQIEGLILDLRGNPGGRFDMALAVATLFLDGSEEAVPGSKGLICSTMSRNDRSVSESRYRVIQRLPYLANAGDEEARRLLAMLQTKPLVVLIDGSSASSAEVVAGALRDNKRAQATIGVPSYGKSVGYQITETPWGGRFSITTMEYLTPAGHDVAREGGVQPTIFKRQPRGGKLDEQLAEAVSFLTRSKFEPIDNADTNQAKQDWLWQYRWTILAGVAAVVLAIIMMLGRRRPSPEQDFSA